MANAAKFHANISNRMASFLTILGGMLNIDLDLSGAEGGFKLTIDSKDGKSMYVTMNPYGRGASINKQIGSPPVIPLTPAAGTLVAGTLTTISLTNAVGDRLVARRTAAGGTPGDLRVSRTGGSTVTVTSYRRTSDASDVVETLDTSTVEVYNLGQA